MKANPIAGKLSGLSILVVEDGIDNQRIFNHFLNLSGAKVAIVADGSSALERGLSDADIDLILMDIQMPLMDGYEVTERLRQGGFTRPIIVITALSQVDRQPMILKYGISDVLTKPVVIEDLIQTILVHSKRDSLPSQVSSSLISAPGADQIVASKADSTLLSKYHDNQVYREIIIAFIRSFEARVKVIQNMVQDMDWDNLSSALHQIKGAAASYGFPQVSESAGLMEEAAKKAKVEPYAVEELQKLMEQMQRMSDRMRGGLRSLEEHALEQK